MTPTISVDLRSCFGDAREQGSRPTCLAFAASDLHASVRIQPFIELSVEYLYYHAIQEESSSHPNNGLTIGTVTEVLRLRGQPEETAWPYLASLPADLSLWRPPIATTLFHITLSHSDIQTDRVFRFLEEGKAVLLVLEITEAFHRPDENALVSTSGNDPVTGFHAVLGVATGTKGSKRFMLLRNSWGNDWGEQGHAWVTEEYLSSTLRSVCVPR